MDMCIAHTLQVMDLIDGYHITTVRAVTGDDEGLTNSPVITSIGLV
jgi:hypothetical protein